MSGFREKKPAPPPCPSNPGMGAEVKIAFSTGDRSWVEEVNLVNLAVAVLREHGHSTVNEKTWLHHPDSGFMILPQLVGMEPLEDGGVRTVTTIQVNHATLSPDGVFEYQHSTGESVADSVSKGFEQWVQTDFVALLDALQPKPASCMALEMEFAASDGQPARVRRAIPGPVAHFMQYPPNEPEPPAAEEHPFCACCLLTKSFEAFRDLIEGDGFYGVRLFAARDEDGTPQADCRVNGEDWEKGAQALREYASTWAAAGYEFRKQYVILQSMEKRAEHL